MKYALVLLIAVAGCGMVAPPPVVGPVRKATPVVATVNPVAAAQKQLASDRADSWDEIVAKVRSGEIKTVAQLADASLSGDVRDSDKFNASLVAYIEKLLNGEDGDLPANAADVLSAIPQGFKDSLK